jgi:hypothetical protein
MNATHRELFAVGIVLSADSESAALVVVEKRPRKTGRIEPVQRGHGVELEETYEDEIVVVAVERCAGGMTAALDRIAEALTHAPLRGDSIAYADTATLGASLPRLLAERGAVIGSFVLGGEAETFDASGTWNVSPAILQARIRLLFESGRLVQVDGLDEGASLLHALEQLSALPESGPARDMALAAAIAVWAAEKHPSDGPWASAKPPPPHSPAAQVFEERELLRRQAIARRRKRGRGWARAMVDGDLEDDS